MCKIKTARLSKALHQADQEREKSRIEGALGPCALFRVDCGHSLGASAYKVTIVEVSKISEEMAWKIEGMGLTINIP